MLSDLRTTLPRLPGFFVLGLSAYLRLTLVAAELRLFGFRRTVRRVRPLDGAEQPLTPEGLRRARRYARYIDTAARHHVLGVHCLQRSLALHRWLRDEGLPSELRIGVWRRDQALQAHAWVELGGYAVNDEPAALAPFTPLYVQRPESLVDGRWQSIRLARNSTW
jgi:hypothetical protein